VRFTSIFDPPLTPSPAQLRQEHEKSRTCEFDRIGLPVSVTAHCSCGWAGEAHDTGGKADSDHRSHVDDVRKTR
jgi:hypothetical protein